MSSNTLNNRSIGQTILDTFFNDIHSALDGDFVGRGATGIPTAGQNLGTLPIPWGTLFATSINLGGSALDTSKITSSPNRVISGKTRSSSNQPAFITPNGAAASLLVAGATTNLQLSIVGSGVTVNTDITKGSLTTAPSSNNTAAVNDATLSGAANTKMLGEYGSFGKITIGTVGSNITALVGKFATFKIVHSAATEYFVAFVESSTLLSHCMRGFFYDSSLNPINPVAVSNADTITLMKTGFVFMTNDALTVDVTYNFPTYSAISPTSPATGDYWYDLVNQVWKRYDGASFQIINRTLIGMVVMDSSNCVAARCVDFAASYSAENTLDLEINSSSTTIIQAKRAGQHVSVAGKLIDFGLQGVLPTWVGANNYVSAADYYAAFTLSTPYYLYVRDDGGIQISDIAPLYRPDLQGWYNRHNPWRCVAFAATDGSSNWTWVDSRQGEKVGPLSELILDSGNGYGATSTKIRRFTNIRKQVGSAFSYVDDSNLGGVITINEEGTYSIHYNDAKSTGSTGLGISVNNSALTTNTPLTYAQGGRAQISSPANGNNIGQVAATLRLAAGDKLYANSDGGCDSTDAKTIFSIIQISR